VGGKKHHVANTKQRGAAILVARSHVLACRLVTCGWTIWWRGRFGRSGSSVIGSLFKFPWLTCHCAPIPPFGFNEKRDEDALAPLWMCETHQWTLINVPMQPNNPTWLPQHNSLLHVSNLCHYFVLCFLSNFIFHIFGIFVGHFTLNK